MSGGVKVVLAAASVTHHRRGPQTVQIIEEWGEPYALVENFRRLFYASNIRELLSSLASGTAGGGVAEIAFWEDVGDLLWPHYNAWLTPRS